LPSPPDPYRIESTDAGRQPRSRRRAGSCTGPGSWPPARPCGGRRAGVVRHELTADFALDKALEAIASKGRLAPQTVRRAAIVGPGLDFTDKAEGYDFYPQQTIQPFALIDSLTRLGLAKPDDLRVTTLDRSPRVNRHLEAARQRALAGEPYVLPLPWRLVIGLAAKHQSSVENDTAKL
jgi:hypothetical protein